MGRHCMLVSYRARAILCLKFSFEILATGQLFNYNTTLRMPSNVRLKSSSSIENVSICYWKTWNYQQRFSNCPEYCHMQFAKKAQIKRVCFDTDVAIEESLLSKATKRIRKRKFYFGEKDDTDNRAMDACSRGLSSECFQCRNGSNCNKLQ
jgi:hypothetical protein